MQKKNNINRMNIFNYSEPFQNSNLIGDIFFSFAECIIDRNHGVD